MRTETLAPRAPEAVARALAADIGAPGIDPSTFELTRIMYWPSHHRDVEPGGARRHRQAAGALP